jgi:hypothetical protein
VKNLRVQIYAGLLLAAANNAALAEAQPSPQAPAGDTIPVTVDNFRRAESDLVMGPIVKDGGFGKYVHHRDLYPVEAPIVRPNRDTLYSFSIFDLDAGPVTIALPNAGQRFMSLQVIDGDQYTPEVHYGAGRYTFAREKFDTRYVQLGVRILVDPNDSEDVKKVHALQDAIKVDQPGGPGRFEVPNWDQASQKKVRDALLVLGATLPDTKSMFGPRDQVDPMRHLIGTAMAYGGNPEKDALYLNITPSNNDGKTVYRVAINGEVPVDGFWSIIVYNDKGYLERNPYNAYSLNSITAKKGADGSITIHLGGCDGKIANCLPTMPGWNYMVRLYRPRAEILNGTWKFPEAEPVN